MTARLLSWWQKIRQRQVAIVLIIIGYCFDVTGFNGYTQVSTIRTLSGPTTGTVTRTETYQPGKTLWDWMQLLFIPVVLAVAGFWFNHRERKAAELRAENERKTAELHAEADREISLDNQREAALKEYIDKMSELLLHEKLRESQPEDEVRKIVRVRTLTVLPRLDGKRKGSVLQFLQESGLIEKGEKRILDMHGVDLSGADLSRAYLYGTNRPIRPVGAIYNGNLSILPFLPSEWLTLGLDTVWQIANDSASLHCNQINP